MFGPFTGIVLHITHMYVYVYVYTCSAVDHNYLT